MAEILGIIKLQIEAGKANPAPPIGPALGQKQVNIMDFCKKFNDQTKDMGGVPCPTMITVYKDKTFSFVIKKPPVSYLIKKITGLKSGSKTPGRQIIQEIKKSAFLEVAKDKMQDMNCHDLDAALKMFAGTARSMGIKVIED